MRKKTRASGWRALAAKYCAITGVAPAPSGGGSGIAAAARFIGVRLQPAGARVSPAIADPHPSRPRDVGKMTLAWKRTFGTPQVGGERTSAGSRRMRPAHVAVHLLRRVAGGIVLRHSLGRNTCKPGKLFSCRKINMTQAVRWPHSESTRITVRLNDRSVWHINAERLHHPYTWRILCSMTMNFNA